MNPLKIVSLTAENFKRLSAVHIEPDGALVQITGKNGEGKSSVLDAIWAALGGKDAAPRKPIRDGQDKAVIKLNLGELTVTRSFRHQPDGGYTTSLTVQNADGATYKSPQTMLDGLWNSLSIDPLEFAEMEDKAQYAALQQFVPGIDFTKIAMEHATDFSRRTELNRKAKELRAAAGMIELPPQLPGAMVDEAALISQLAACSQHNTEIEQRKGNREAARVKITKLKEEAASFQQTAAKLMVEFESIKKSLEEEYKKRLAEVEEDYKKRVSGAEERHKGEIERLTTAANGNILGAEELNQRLEAAPPLPEPMDPAQIQAQISEARANNELYTKYKRRKELEDQAANLETGSDELTQIIEVRQAAKNAAISGAKMPVEGLGFGDGYITLNGVPFDQASDADKLKVSLSIAMAANPKLRIIRAKNGSLLDSNAIKVITQMVTEHGYQLWLERMDESGKVGIVIEDGQLKSTIKEVEVVS